ncbi:hypothetical protein [Bradyrhizobium sp.]|uniref:hypothetical protein n=1 Tax=Bradyrhizobium sp. TaxID=376 RepID=UPI003C738642
MDIAPGVRRREIGPAMNFSTAGDLSKHALSENHDSKAPPGRGLGVGLCPSHTGEPTASLALNESPQCSRYDSRLAIGAHEFLRLRKQLVVDGDRDSHFMKPL